MLPFFEHILPECYGLDTGVEDLADGEEGVTWPDGRVLVSVNTYESAERADGRARFTVAHECGHGIMHCKEIEKSLTDSKKIALFRRFDLVTYRDPEWQADYFAGGLLMPRQAVERLVTRRNWLFLAEIMKEEFGVSYTAAQVRIAKLELHKKIA